MPYSEAYHPSQRLSWFLQALPSNQNCKRAGKRECKSKLLLFVVISTHLVQLVAETPWEGIAAEPEPAIWMRPEGLFGWRSETWPIEAKSSSKAEIQDSRDIPYPRLPPSILICWLGNMALSSREAVPFCGKTSCHKTGQGSFLSHTHSISSPLSALYF